MYSKECQIWRANELRLCNSITTTAVPFPPQTMLELFHLRHRPCWSWKMNALKKNSLDVQLKKKDFVLQID